MAKNKDKSKDAKTVEKNVEKAVKRSSSSSWFKDLLILTSVVVALTAVASYKVYDSLLAVPELPKVDLNVWWGENTTEKQDVSIRPFRIIISDPMEEQLRRKFDAYRAILVRKKSFTETWEYGINSDAFSQVFSHWQFKYSYRERQRILNQFNHFKTNIQGLDIHFIHVKPQVGKNVKVLPLILLHGWPSSIREFYDVIPLLTKQREGYDFVFEVIVPSLPGFVYSEAPKRPGLSPFQIAIVMRNLMQRLGFKKYYVQGGDFGSTIGTHMATIFPNEVLGLHTNFPVNPSKLASLAWLAGGIWPSIMGDELNSTWMYPVKDKIEFFLEEFGYIHLQGTKPDTIGIALTDSPIGLASYILDKLVIYTNRENKFIPDGGLSNFDISAILDNIMLYWTTSSITTSLRLYKESLMSEEESTMINIPTPVPTWGLRFKNELMHQPDFILRWKYPNLVGTTNIDHGGHYGAFECPKELADDVFLAVNNFLKQ